MLNIAAYRVVKDVLGPGIRLCIWVQGCKRRCPGCLAPEWQPLRPAMLFSPESFAERCAGMEFDGITLSGGEPFLQARALAAFLALLPHRGNVICFTGNRYEDLCGDAEAGALLQYLDVVIDGEYQEESNTGIGLRGSDNQRIISLRKGLSVSELEAYPRRLELYGEEDGIFLVGIPDKRTWPCLKSLFDGKNTMFSNMRSLMNSH